MSSIQVPISVGELVDKITILRIKKKHITESAKLQNIDKELGALVACCGTAKIDLRHTLVEQLEKVNQKLWKIEDDIRDKERAKQFDSKFIELARAVYQVNDERFALKRALNETFGSEYKEEKSYKSYL
jgi:hypothetical protein